MIRDSLIASCIRGRSSQGKIWLPVGLQACISHLGDLQNGCPGSVWERYTTSSMSDTTMRKNVLLQLSQTHSGPQHQVPASPGQVS